MIDNLLSFRPSMKRKGLNLMMPGNPRYQPKPLIPYFGYDLLYSYLAYVEIANLLALGEIGVISRQEMRMLTPTRVQKLLDITTTEVDDVESKVTRHDVRAWVRIAQQRMNCSLSRWLHVPLTSYDGLDTARDLQFVLSYKFVVRPLIMEFFGIMVELIRRFADQLQIGRTHRQAALPITVGFWMGTITGRMTYSAWNMQRSALALPGIITGAVGARNAEMGLGIHDRCRGQNYGEIVLPHIGLKECPISTTQIMPPEFLANYLFQCLMLSGAFGQFGRDGRCLMSTEIAEVKEAKEAGQVCSSTMAGKENPIFFENTEGFWWKEVAEFQKMLFCMISDNQRDLVGSPLARDLSVCVINPVHQIMTFTRKNKEGIPFLSRLTVNADNCRRNFDAVSGRVLGEPLYIALQMAGYQGDAHQLVNDILAPRARKSGKSLVIELENYSDENPLVAEALGRIPAEVVSLFHHPEKYTGDAKEQALQMADMAEEFCNYQFAAK